MTSEQSRSNRRRILVESRSLLAEEFVAHAELPPRGVTTKRQLVITYAGAFEFQVGRSVSWVDTSRLLLAEAGHEYMDRHVIPGVGHRSIFLAPTAAALDELSPNAAKLFAERVRGCTLRTKLLAHRMRRAADPLAREELGFDILIEGLAGSRRVAAHDSRCVRKAKALMHDVPDGRRTLSDVATEVGVSPIHLTQAFKRSEGLPLYRYQSELRLTRALEKLPDCEDITGLALDLGYSSHSHFTAAFRARTGMTPSAYRSGVLTDPDCDMPADSAPVDSGRDACPNR